MCQHVALLTNFFFSASLLGQIANQDNVFFFPDIENFTHRQHDRKFIVALVAATEFETGCAPTRDSASRRLTTLEIAIEFAIEAGRRQVPRNYPR